MRKCFVTVALGERHLHLEKLHGASRRAYAERHGYDYILIDRVPESIAARASEVPPRLQGLLSKLGAPSVLKEYDFAVYMDNDTVVNALAPCLSLYASHIPAGGFAAAQDISAQERRVLFPNWSHDYYTHVEHKGLTGVFSNRDLYINSGLLVYKPKEVMERWKELAVLPFQCGDENRLNAYEVQQGRCYMLPPNWNTVWYFEKFRIGYLTPERSRFISLRNKVRNKLSIGERQLAIRTLHSVHMLHFAFEISKLGLVADQYEPGPRKNH